MGLGGVLGAELQNQGVSPDCGFPTLWGCSSHEVGSEGPHLVWELLLIPS